MIITCKTDRAIVNRRLAGWLSAAIMCALVESAGAHIEYYDLNQGRHILDLTAAGKAVRGNDLPISNPAYWTSTYQTAQSAGETWTSLGGSFASGTWGYSVRVVDMDSSAWTDGLRNNPTGGSNLLGDTHKMDFANFHLSQAAKVTITVSDGLPAGYGLNPSFSLYRGSAVYQAHDGSTVDPLNPQSATPPFSKVQSAKDTGAVVDSQGIKSPYRNTLTNTGTYYGQFNALGGWSAGNAAGDWSTVQYITSVTGQVNPSGDWTGNAKSNSLTDYLLPAGDYIIAFGGNAQLPSYASVRSADLTSPYGAVTNQIGTLTFRAVAVPVPEPQAWVLTLSGLLLLGGVARRRCAVR